MTGHRKASLLLYDYVSGTLGGDEARMVERHIASCAECSREAESHRALLKAVPGPAPRPSDALPDSYWTGFANEVMGRLDTAPKRPAGLAERLLGSRYAGGRWYGARSLPVRLAAGLASAAVVAGIAWFLSPRGVEETSPATNATAMNGASKAESAAPDTLTDFDRRLSNYFKQSKALLVGVSNIKTPEGEAMDLGAERRLSRSLLSEARYLKAGPVDSRSARLIDDLDRILIGLANGDEGASRPDIEVLRGGIRDRNLLFKLRMEETRQFSLPVSQAMYRK